MPMPPSPYSPTQLDPSKRNASFGGLLLSMTHPSDHPGIKQSFGLEESSKPEPQRDPKEFVDEYVEEKVSVPGEDSTRYSSYRRY